MSEKFPPIINNSEEPPKVNLNLENAEKDYDESQIEKIGLDFHKEDINKSLREYLEKNKDNADPVIQENVRIYEEIINRSLKDNSEQ